MGDAPEVVREVGVNDFRVAAKQLRFHLDHRLLGVSPGTVRVLFWWKVGFEDRFQHQHCCCHADPITQGRDAQRPELAVGLRDEHSSDRIRMVALLPERKRQFGKPPLDAIRLDVREVLTVCPRRALVGAALGERMGQNVLTADLVVQRVEAIAGLCLRFRVQRLLQFSEQFSELIGCPISKSLTTCCVCFELRSLPSTGVTRLQRYYEPLRHPKAPSLSLAGVRLVIADHAMGLPVLRTLSLCTCCRHYPGAAAGRTLRSASPSHISLPRKGDRVGLRIVLFEDCSAFTRVTACTLALSPIRDTLIEGFSHFVTSMTAPIASGWSGCRVGLTPTGKRRLCTAHTRSGHQFRIVRPPCCTRERVRVA